MTTTLQFDNVGWMPPFTNPYDHIVMTVELTCGIRVTNRILLQTYYAPQP